MKKNSLMIVLVIITILVVGSLVFLLGDLFNHDTPVNPSVTPTPSIDVEEDSKYDVDLIEYKTYKLDDIDFNFIIAKIRIKSEDSPFSVDLDEFYTSEDIKLNDYQKYVNQLEKKQYYLGKQNVWFNIESLENSYIGNIFIPYENKNLDELSLFTSLNSNIEIKFDLNKNIGNKDDLFYYEPDDIITDGEKYQMSVSSAIEITGDKITRTYEDGYSEDFLYPSNSKVYAFKIEVSSLKGEEVIIEKATYYVDDSTSSFDALNEQFKSMKYDNIIGKKITDTNNGTLLFITTNPSENPITFKGVLKIKLVGQDNWIEVRVDL